MPIFVFLGQIAQKVWCCSKGTDGWTRRPTDGQTERQAPWASYEGLILPFIVGSPNTLQFYSENCYIKLLLILSTPNFKVWHAFTSTIFKSFKKYLHLSAFILYLKRLFIKCLYIFAYFSPNQMFLYAPTWTLIFVTLQSHLKYN